MSAKHTPGPWLAVRIEFGAIDIVAGPERNTIATVEGAGNLDTPTSQIENARLIAAAPELLVALKAVLENPEHYATGPGRSLIRAAIAKAEGKR